MEGHWKDFGFNKSLSFLRFSDSTQPELCRVDCCHRWASQKLKDKQAQQATVSHFHAFPNRCPSNSPRSSAQRFLNIFSFLVIAFRYFRVFV